MKLIICTIVLLQAMAYSCKSRTEKNSSTKNGWGSPGQTEDGPSAGPTAVDDEHLQGLNEYLAALAEKGITSTLDDLVLFKANGGPISVVSIKHLENGYIPAHWELSGRNWPAYHRCLRMRDRYNFDKTKILFVENPTRCQQFAMGSSEVPTVCVNRYMNDGELAGQWVSSRLVHSPCSSTQNVNEYGCWGTEAYDPVFSPASQYAAFVKRDEGNNWQNIATVGTNYNHQAQVENWQATNHEITNHDRQSNSIKGQYANRQPSWNRNGDKIVFASSRLSNTEIAGGCNSGQCWEGPYYLWIAENVNPSGKSNDLPRRIGGESFFVNEPVFIKGEYLNDLPASHNECTW